MRVDNPYRLPLRMWGKALKDLRKEIKDDNVSVVAAALAYYGMLAIFPGLIALVSIYGLFLDPAQIEAQIAPVARILPPAASELVTTQLHDLVVRAPASLRIGLFVSILGLLWSASSGVNSLLRGINLAYCENESRGFIKLRGVAFLTTLAMLLFGIVAIAAVAVVPPMLEWMGAPPIATELIEWARWPVLALLVMAGLAVLYRYAPDRRPTPHFRWVTPGSILATAMWLLGSWGFSVYTQHFGTYNETYGALGAVIVLLLWLWLSAFSILVGAELNAVLEAHAGRLHPEQAREKRNPREPEPQLA
jgi:membrane protein